MNPVDESARLKSLLEYDILDSAPEQAFDDLAKLAASICGVPVAMISLIDANRQWYKATVGFDASVTETPRDDAFCNYTIQQKEILVVPDATQDARFADNPYVVNKPQVRFYAGYPLQSREGHGIGSICIVDVKPREMTQQQRDALEALGRQATMQLELRRRLRENKEALRTIQESKEQFADFANQVEAVLWTVEMDGSISFVNSAYEKIWDRRVEDLLANPNSFLDAVHPEDSARVRASFARLQTTGNFEEIYRIVRRDGSIRWIHDRAYAHYNEAGQMVRFPGVAADITKQKEAETDRNRFFNSSADLFAIHQLGCSQFEQVNGSWEKALGYSPEDICRMNFIDLGHPDEQEGARQAMSNLALGQDLVEYRTRMRHQDGSWRWLEWHIPAPPPGQKTVYSVARDVTSQVEAEEMLKRRSSELETTFNIFPDLFFQLDLDGRVVDFHGGQAGGRGPFSGECIGRFFLDLLPSDVVGRLKHAKDEARRTNLLQQVEFMWTSGSSELSFEVRFLSYNEGEVVVLVRDITDRALADRAQRAAREAAESASRSKSEFLASMSHELRTPLNAILNISESMGEGIYGSLNDKQQRSLQTVSESGRHLLGLINDILDLSKIEAGKLELNLTEVSVQPLCEASLRLVREQALLKAQEVSLEIDPELKVVAADERKLKQILVNLLSNASKFTPWGGKFGIKAEIEDGTASFCVWDTGIGITPTDIKKLFQPFVQLDSKLSREYAGTGLGLSLAQRLAALHRGQVNVESVPGLGSRFTLHLPISRADVESIHPRLKTQRLSMRLPVAGSGPRVLLVEDLQANRECIGDYLEAKGFRVQYATNGFDAIRFASASIPDVILTDIQMSGMDGFETIRGLRKNPELRETPIIALTALAMDGDSDRCLAAGATHYLSKPVMLKELSRLLMEIVENVSAPKMASP